LILQVLASSSDARHRAIAAQTLGYGRQSNGQIDALVRASLDGDDEVRNDAVRALWVLAGAKPSLAKSIPLDPLFACFGRARGRITIRRLYRSWR
jgi:hypothetical protein